MHYVQRGQISCSLLLTQSNSIKSKSLRGQRSNSVCTYVSSMPKALGSTSSPGQSEQGGPHLEPSTQELEAEAADIQSQPQEESESKASLGYRRVCV